MPWLSMCRQKKGESLLATTDVWKVGALVFPFCASVLDGNEILCWGSWWQCERPDSWFCARFPRHERVVDQHFVKLFIIPPREVHGAEWGCACDWKIKTLYIPPFDFSPPHLEHFHLVLQFVLCFLFRILWLFFCVGVRCKIYKIQSCCILPRNLSLAALSLSPLL